MKFVYFTKGVYVNPAHVCDVCVRPGRGQPAKYDANGARGMAEAVGVLVYVNMVTGKVYCSEMFQTLEVAADFTKDFISAMQEEI